MSLFVLDTDILSLNQQQHPVVTQRVAEHTAEEIALCVISVEEQLNGWYTLLRRAKEKAALAKAYSRLTRCVSSLSSLTVLPFDEGCIDRYELLRASKVPVRTMDLRIAATVLEFGGVLVTRNWRDFSNVPGLELEDWSKPNN